MAATKKRRCPKCGSREEYADGRCGPCRRSYMAVWRRTRGAKERRALTGPAIYVLWAPGRKRAYVGQSGNISRRLVGHSAALLLGATVEVTMLPTGTSKAKRERLELERATALFEEGVEVVGSPGRTGAWFAGSGQRTSRRGRAAA